MRNNLEYNLQSIAKRYPALADRLKTIKDDGTTRVVATRYANSPTCYFKTPDNEWLLHSREDPRKEADFFIKIVLRNSLKAANTIVLFGFGMGYYLESILSSYGHLSPNIIVIERDIQVFKRFIEQFTPMVNFGGKQLPMFEFPQCHWIVGVPQDQIYFHLYDIIHDSNRTSFSTFHIVEHPIIIRYTKEYYKPVTSEIHRICYDVRSSYGNDPEDSWIGIDHMLKNLSRIVSHPGAERVAGKFSGKPAVIVATGPSLNKNIHLLPQIKDKCVLFAADASLKTMLSHDPIIKPDIVCCLERNLSTRNHFEQIPNDNKHHMQDIYLAACPVVMPVVYDAWKGDRHMIIFRDFAHFKWLGLKTAVLNTGKSVTNMAFKIAEYMGCDPIILVGQDLAYAADGQSHVAGADHARDGLAASPLKLQRVKVLGNDGTMLDSLDTWIGMLKRFEFDIARKPYPYRVINATEGGAFIKGTEVMPLKQAIEQYMPNDIGTSVSLNNLMLPFDDIEIQNNINTINSNVVRGIDYVRDSHKKISDMMNEMEAAFPTIMNGDFSTMNEVLMKSDKLKTEMLGGEMCYFTIMHVLQSWCMGRDTLLRGLEHYVSASEDRYVKCIKVFEFFYGLSLLYDYVYKGMVKDYYGER